MRIEIPSALNTAFLAGAMLFLPSPADAALPEGWTLNEYRTYLPLCRAETLTNAEGSVSIRLTDAPFSPIILFEVYPCFPAPATFNKQNQETETADR